MNHAPAAPCVLLVEDDPVSAGFLVDALTALPVRAVLAGTLADAIALASRHPFDLLLLDANLPDGSGMVLLQRLRQHGLHAVALAHTADTDPGLHAALREAGFLDVLPKPLTVARLHAALRKHLPTHSVPAWDDAAALAALGGQAAHVQALREMFLADLPQQQARILAASQRGDAAGVRAELHKLVASCGFVGALALRSAVQQMQASPLDPACMQAVAAAITALHSSA